MSVLAPLDVLHAAQVSATIMVSASPLALLGRIPIMESVKIVAQIVMFALVPLNAANAQTGSACLLVRAIRVAVQECG